MKTPKINWVSDFPDGELEKYIPSGEETVLVAIDTEYTRHSEFSNLCLSYQFSVLDCATGNYMKKIYYPELVTEVRLTLKEILLQVFRMMSISSRKMNGYHVMFICHFCSAEWAMMHDRKETSKYLEFLYKTVITFKPIEVTFEDSEGVSCAITFEVGDTMLLLPPTHRSLEKASSLLDEKFHKKELTQFEKEHMNSLLQTDPERFYEYAIHDADITLRLFIKLQYTLNKMNGSENTRYTTIGSATVKHFVKAMDKKIFKSQFSKRNKIYQDGLNLAKRAYMGGLNSSYFVGELEGELFIDADFSGAYPTVMNLLEVSDFGKPIVKVKDDPFSLGDIDD
ncbi:MAG: hypothetical protein GQ531_03150 [Sulfurovum sp.]|nr:hypothetical protein [Sulfurovum sp.]